MKRKILLVAVLASSLTAVAQNFNSKTSLWLQSNKAVQGVTALNKNAPTDVSSQQAMVASIGAGPSNFYMVFKSNDAVETDLLNFTFTCNQHNVTTHNINYTDAAKVEQKRKTGAIVKYGFDFPNAVGDKNYVTVVNNPKDLTDLYEVIYVNEAFTNLDHQKIQTYLSVKYGISLINVSNYVDSDGKTIWNSGLNNQYNNFITGLGRSDYFNLNQSKTINSVDNRLELISSNFRNNEYLFVGTTNEKTSFQKTTNGELLESSWLVQTNTRSNLNTLKFNLGENLHKTGVYELIINQNTAEFVTSDDVIRVVGKVVGNELVFENVMFDADGNGFDTFSIGYSAMAKETSKPEIVSNSEIKAFPNPANLNENVLVQYQFDKPTNLNIHVFSVDGKLLDKQEVNNTLNYQFQTKFAAAGVYLILSTYNGQVNTNKVIIK